jgi:polyhydroxyalkanoate synthesis regulator phasin
MTELENILKLIEEALADGSMSKEEAKELLLDAKRTLEIHEGASDIELKAVLLASVAVLMELV